MEQLFNVMHCPCNCPYTEAHTSSLLHNIYYSLLQHVLATGSDHLQGATNFIDLYNTYCK